MPEHAEPGPDWHPKWIVACWTVPRCKAPIRPRVATSVPLTVSVPGMDRAAAQALVDAAHEVCPYSNATRGNIDVSLKVA